MTGLFVLVVSHGDRSGIQHVWGPFASEGAASEAWDIYRALYGDPNGHWLLVTAPCDLISPPWLHAGIPLGQTVQLRNLGDPADVARQLHDRHGGRKVPVQAGLARLLGVTQQQFSRYANGDPPPLVVLPRLVGAWFSARSVEDAIGEIVAARGDGR